ncbi:type II toxin-antitoxin system RelE/ParE family toxin [Anaerotignum sp. MSJ-24]|uniref:type II toxin-antitoxin system RelE/ParE family toxin n=1 Tax=Anaerotignum sp. MSJ-24 TaxID=2841521 RepID=UPI002ED5943B
MTVYLNYVQRLARIFREFCIFFYYEGRIILTNGFVKKIQKTPQNEIALAKKYRRDFLEGNDR